MTSIPSDFASALRVAKLADFFAASSNSHQNEYLKWIAEAKRPETRQARITKAIQMLSKRRGAAKSRSKKEVRAERV